MATYKELAAKYNTTPDQIRQAQIDWACNEGYDESGNEHETLASWLNMRFGRGLIKEPYEPMHKGDETCL